MLKINSLIIYSLILISCKSKQNIRVETSLSDEEKCALLKDSTITTSLTLYNDEKGLDSLIHFIESKTEFRVTKQKEYHQPRKDSIISFQKIICFYDYFQTKNIFYIFENTFSKTVWLKSIKSIRGYKSYFPLLSLTQISFANSQEKDKVLNVFKKVGWGNPIKKWNDNSYTNDDTHIYILENDDATFQDYDNKYIQWLKKNWINKNNS